MHKKLRCCFAGHDKMYGNEMCEKIKKTAEVLITRFNVNEFWIGNYGQFDLCASNVLRKLKKECNIEIDLIIPYLTKDIRQHVDLYQRKYDNILIADIPVNTPKRFYILKANEYMINNSDYLICNIEYSWGGAAKTLEYAKRKEIQIFNLSKNTPCI